MEVSRQHSQKVCNAADGKKKNNDNEDEDEKEEKELQKPFNCARN